MKFLVVDDYEDIRKGLKAALEMDGHEVLEAADGREALEVFRRESTAGRAVDVALLDYNLPHYKGDIVADGIRRFAQADGVKVPRMVALTGSEDAHMVGRLKTAGVLEMVIKGADDFDALKLRLYGVPAGR